MKTRIAVLVAAILMLGLGAALVFVHTAHAVLILSSLGFLFGTATLNYKYPLAGTVAPSSTLMQAHNILTAQAIFADADTLVTITHNWGLPATDFQGFPNGPAALFPAVIVNIDAASTTTVQPIFTVSLTNTNAVVINKPTTVGTQGTFDVVILRPDQVIK